MFINALFMSVFYTVTIYVLILWITVAKTEISLFRSATYTLIPVGDGKEPLQNILSEYQNCDSLGRCGVSCLSNKWCFSFYHNSGQRRCILTSRQNVTLFTMTPGFAQYLTRECIRSKAGWQYAGNRQHTISGRECHRWDQQTPHNHSYQSLADQENFCRNAHRDRREEAGPWCYTTDANVTWESCGIPLCYDFSKNCKTTENGIDYYGTRNVTKDGSICKHWSNIYAFLGDHHNYCRNPFGEMSYPWCYTDGGGIECDIPTCG